MNDNNRIGAAIDIGSNSVHLLVAEIEDGRPRVIHDESMLLGLGAVVDLEGRVPDDEAARAIAVITDYIAAAADEGAEWIAVLATEPLRRASNRTHFADAVEEATGRPLHVLSHDEEAELTLLGVLGGEPVEEPILVLDIGGGSSEIVLIDRDADPVVGVMPVGSARLTAAHVEDDPPTAEEVDALRAEAHNLLSGMPAGHPSRGIVVGGSGTNLVRLTAGEAEDEDEEDNIIDKSRIDEAISIVTAKPSHELADTYGLRERRIVQMAAGASLIEATLDCYSLESMEASDSSLREGAIIAWAHAGSNWRDQISSLVSGD
jgi:exopolyphosphatase/pppGpp-phosphohydrolase